jgi:hypothetical protein
MVLARSSNAAIERITCGELLDDLLENARTNIKPSTEKIWRLVIEANIRPFFGPPESHRPDDGNS